MCLVKHPTFYIPQDVSRSDIIGCKDQSVECCGCAGEVTSHQCRGRSLASSEPASGTEQLLTNTPPPVRGQLGSARAAVQAIQPQKYLDSEKKYLWDTGDTRYMLIFILECRSALPTQQCHCIVQKTVITVNSIILMLLVTRELVFCYVIIDNVKIWLKEENDEDAAACWDCIHGDECFSHKLQKSSLIDYLDIVYFESETIFQSLVENWEIIFKCDPEISSAKESAKELEQIVIVYNYSLCRYAMKTRSSFWLLDEL